MVPVKRRRRREASVATNEDQRKLVTALLSVMEKYVSCSFNISLIDLTNYYQDCKDTLLCEMLQVVENGQAGVLGLVTRRDKLVVIKLISPKHNINQG